METYQLFYLMAPKYFIKAVVTCNSSREENGVRTFDRFTAKYYDAADGEPLVRFMPEEGNRLSVPTKGLTLIWVK